jgi:pyrimidine operon attenuation protein/uracil phosphoribosyltransferase
VVNRLSYVVGTYWASTTLVVISNDYIGKYIYHTSTSCTTLVAISTDYIGKSIYTSVVEDVLVW